MDHTVIDAPTNGRAHRTRITLVAAVATMAALVASVIAGVPARAADPVVAPADLAITGDPRVGALLEITGGAWSPADPVLAVTWRVDGQEVVDESEAASPLDLAVRPEWLGKTVSADVHAMAEGYDPLDVTLTAAAPIAAGAFTTAAAPTISGINRVDSTVTAVPGTWSPAPTFAYSWKVDGKQVSVAQTLRPTAAQRGHRLTLTVTASLSGYASVTQTTAAYTIGYGAFAAAPVPKVSGTMQIGKTVKVVTGTWSPSATLRYQWLRNGAAIKGATKSSYELTSSDWKKKVTVRVTAARSGYVATIRTSAASAIVTKPFSKVKTPTVSGTVRVGSTLTAKTSAWSPKATFSYQWKRNGAAIPGATHKTYKLASADYGKKITVTVKGKRSGYVTASRTSASTKSVVASVGQKAALAKAQRYIDLMAFSKAGLYEQLTSPYGEGFRASEAQFAVDHVRVNWNAEAAEAARSYMRIFDMSRDELYQQLTSPYGEQFTPSQALAGLAAVGY